MKTKFISKYQLSDATPMDPTIRSLPAEAFSAAIEEFINDRFGGIARVRSRDLSAEAVLVSADYAAYFFKMLLTYVYGKVFLNFDISCDRQGLTILITSEEDLPLTDSELRFLIKTARNAGMEIYPNGQRIELTLAFSRAALHRVYAVSVADGKRIMLGKLTEIFHCGTACTINTASSKK